MFVWEMSDFGSCGFSLLMEFRNFVAEWQCHVSGGVECNFETLNRIGHTVSSIHSVSHAHMQTTPQQ